MSFNFGELCFISCALEQLGFSDHTDTNIDGRNALQVSYDSRLGFIRIQSEYWYRKAPSFIIPPSLSTYRFLIDIAVFPYPCIAEEISFRRGGIAYYLCYHGTGFF